MLKNKTKFVAFLLIVFILFSTFSTVLADDESDIVTSEDTSVTAEDIQNTIADQQSKEDSYKESDVFLAENEVTVDYIVDGNAFICANTVTINSQIGGDAFICAKKIVIEDEGYIYSNLFAVAESIEIKGVVYGAFVATRTLNISGGYVYRDISATANTINFNGAVGRNANLTCDSLNFNTIENENAIIYGNLNYTSSQEASIPEGVVDGEVNFTASTTETTQKSVRAIVSDYLFDLCRFVIFVMVIGAAFLLKSPKFLANSKEFIGKKSLKLFGAGLLAYIVIPVICILLICLGVTVNVSLLLLGLYILGAMIANSLFVISANSFICSKYKIEKKSSSFGILIATAVIAWILTKLPYIGVLASIIFSCIGLGIIVISALPKKAKKEVEVKAE